MEKKWFALVLLVAGSLCLSAKKTSQNDYNPSNQPNSTPTQPNLTPPPSNTPRNGMNGQSMSPNANCAQLTPDEQDFANQLNPTNKTMFCTKFSADMRASAIEMSGQMGPDGMLVTNDQAVEQVARDNNIMMPMTAPPMRQGGSCPAK